MRIWFDLSNSPHINLFARMIRELQADGHEVIITCRPLANTIDLLDLHGFQYEVVGEHYGAKFWKKLFGSLKTVSHRARKRSTYHCSMSTSSASM